jgi:tripartite-type tricarboxylate transporter receptor subunit TctC
MKLFIASILCMFILPAYSFPDTFNVYATSGVRNITCRALFDLYAQQYNVHPNYIAKDGAGGLIGMLAMINDKTPSVACMGPSETIFNNTQYPGHEKEHEELKTITIAATGSVVFYTSNNSIYSDLKELINSNTRISIGYHTAANKTAAQLALNGREVLWVPFNTPASSISSLMDGSVTVYVETGSLDSIAKSGKIKSLGYIGKNSDMSGPDITKDFPLATAVPVFISVTTNSSTSQKDIEELNMRLQVIIHSKEFRDALSIISWLPAGTSVKETNDIIYRARTETKRLGMIN